MPGCRPGGTSKTAQPASYRKNQTKPGPEFSSPKNGREIHFFKNLATASVREHTCNFS